MRVCVHINEVTCFVCFFTLWKHTPAVTCEYYSDIIKKLFYIAYLPQGGKAGELVAPQLRQLVAVQRKGTVGSREASGKVQTHSHHMLSMSSCARSCV